MTTCNIKPADIQSVKFDKLEDMGCSKMIGRRTFRSHILNIGGLPFDTNYQKCACAAIKKDARYKDILVGDKYKVSDGSCENDITGQYLYWYPADPKCAPTAGNPRLISPTLDDKFAVGEYTQDVSYAGDTTSSANLTGYMNDNLANYKYRGVAPTSYSANDKKLHYKGVPLQDDIARPTLGPVEFVQCHLYTARYRRAVTFNYWDNYYTKSDIMAKMVSNDMFAAILGSVRVPADAFGADYLIYSAESTSMCKLELAAPTFIGQLPDFRSIYLVKIANIDYDLTAADIDKIIAKKISIRPIADDAVSATYVVVRGADRKYALRYVFAIAAHQPRADLAAAAISRYFVTPTFDTAEVKIPIIWPAGPFFDSPDAELAASPGKDAWSQLNYAQTLYKGVPADRFDAGAFYVSRYHLDNIAPRVPADAELVSCMSTATKYSKKIDFGVYADQAPKAGAAMLNNPLYTYGGQRASSVADGKLIFVFGDGRACLPTIGEPKFAYYMYEPTFTLAAYSAALTWPADPDDKAAYLNSIARDKFEKTICGAKYLPTTYSPKADAFIYENVKCDNVDRPAIGDFAFEDCATDSKSIYSAAIVFGAHDGKTRKPDGKTASRAELKKLMIGNRAYFIVVEGRPYFAFDDNYNSSGELFFKTDRACGPILDDSSMKISRYYIRNSAGKWLFDVSFKLIWDDTVNKGAWLDANKSAFLNTPFSSYSADFAKVYYSAVELDGRAALPTLGEAELKGCSGNMTEFDHEVIWPAADYIKRSADSANDAFIDWPADAKIKTILGKLMEDDFYAAHGVRATSFVTAPPSLKYFVSAEICVPMLGAAAPTRYLALDRLEYSAPLEWDPAVTEDQKKNYLAANYSKFTIRLGDNLYNGARYDPAFGAIYFEVPNLAKIYPAVSAKVAKQWCTGETTKIVARRWSSQFAIDPAMMVGRAEMGSPESADADFLYFSVGAREYCGEVEDGVADMCDCGVRLDESRTTHFSCAPDGTLKVARPIIFTYMSSDTDRMIDLANGFIGSAGVIGLAKEAGGHLVAITLARGDPFPGEVWAIIETGTKVAECSPFILPVTKTRKDGKIVYLSQLIFPANSEMTDADRLDFCAKTKFINETKRCTLRPDRNIDLYAEEAVSSVSTYITLGVSIFTIIASVFVIKSIKLLFATMAAIIIAVVIIIMFAK